MITAQEYMEKTARPFGFNPKGYSNLQKRILDRAKEVSAETAKAATDSAAALKKQMEKMEKIEKGTKNIKQNSLLLGGGAGVGATVATNHFTGPKDDDI